jgi:SAM-dependent methyltransferase
VNYELAYRIGFHPWEDAAGQPEFRHTIASLLDAQEPPGSALDLGTGSGIWAVELARRGWDVTGVDTVPRALDRARERARHEGVPARFEEADVTDLGGLGSGFNLLLDTGTFHGLRAAQREAMARSVTAVAAAEATLLLLAWTPRRRGPLPRGADVGEIAAAFDGWDVAEAGPSGFRAPKPIELLLDPGERWYRLRRR